MGWLSQAHAAGRIRLGGSPKQRRGPLRKIVKRTYRADSIFDRDQVVLECGHLVSSNGVYKARCPHCAEMLVVEIVAFEGDKVVKRFKPHPPRKAEHIDGGVNINLNHELYYTRLVPAWQPKKKGKRKK